MRSRNALLMLVIAFTGASLVGGSPDAVSGQEGGFFAGAEATYLALNSTVLERHLPADFNDTVPATATLDYGMQAAPRIWLGYLTENGWGGQVRYWQYDVNSSIVEPQVMQPFSLSNEIQMYTIDFEGLKRFQFDSGALTLTFGGRHASFQSDQQYALVDVFGVGGFTDEIRNTSAQFNGGGLTGSFLYTRPLNFGGWEAFASGRVSALWGKESRRDRRLAAGLGLLTVNSADPSAEQYTVEAQIGLQWTHSLNCCCGAELFVRSAFEYQHWDTSASPVNIAGPPSALDADLYGVAVSVGLRR